MADTFDVTGSGSHTTNISNLTDGVNYNYYIRCDDGLGNSNMSDEVVNITVDANVNTFITEWDTSAGAGNSGLGNFKLQLSASGSYNFHVDWGDGTTDSITSWDQVESQHNYNTGALYQVTINGTIEDIGFASEGVKLTDISQWGNVILSNQGFLFMDTNNITSFSATDTPDLSTLTNLAGMFYGSSFNGDISNWDVSNITNMSSMFAQS
ncbi:MAG: BspA family leucine-rich repeat surface protein, partial [Candidatus Gracilibacteria bacterium]|nr:BspA family leucine-rich repeat surface protein [Candidatus Gracilibacteria bacterium]